MKERTHKKKETQKKTVAAFLKINEIAHQMNNRLRKCHIRRYEITSPFRRGAQMEYVILGELKERTPGWSAERKQVYVHLSFEDNWNDCATKKKKHWLPTDQSDCCCYGGTIIGFCFLLFRGDFFFLTTNHFKCSLVLEFPFNELSPLKSR